MSFFKEAGAAAGIDLIKLSSGYQIINYNGEAVYIEGFKQLYSISDTEILLLLKKDIIKVTGEELKVFDLEESTVIIKGKIRICEVTGTNEIK